MAATKEKLKSLENIVSESVPEKPSTPEKLSAPERPSDSKKLSAKEQILQTATRLFYEHGFRAVGIDTIIAESGVAKMTLYKHFPSKDDLIVAYLERSDEAFWNWLGETVKPFENKPKKQLEVIFEGVAKLASSPQCMGCTFTSAAGEFPSLEHISHTAALSHKKQVLARFEALAKAANLRQPQALAEQLLMLMDGAWNAARMFGPGSHAGQVAGAAKILIAASS
jgi:AcrR family transcriptional regulator